MALAAQATVIAGFPGHIGITCHQATWYWAALEAQALAMAHHRLVLDRMEKIGKIPGSPQGAMLAMPQAPYDFNNPGGAAPAFGTVLLWTAAPTHSAVYTANGIAGYNQSCVFPNVPATGTYSCQPPGNLAATARKCFMITEANIVKVAGNVFAL